MRKPTKNLAGKVLLLCLAAALLAALAVPCRAERIKDLGAFEGVRENPLIGYGLVVGLEGQGDNKGPMVQATINMLQRMGLVIQEDDISPRTPRRSWSPRRFPPSRSPAPGST